MRRRRRRGLRRNAKHAVSRGMHEEAHGGDAGYAKQQANGGGGHEEERGCEDRETGCATRESAHE
eukprot:4152024-Pleurochrysis_carterae.AAC.1